MLPSRFRVIGKGIKKAIPNMIYGNVFFIISLVIRPRWFSTSLANGDIHDFLSTLAGLSILFFAGVLIAILPVIVGGGLLSLWLHKEKDQITLPIAARRGAIVGLMGMALVCVVLYPIDQPHGLPDPTFPLNASTAILISTIAGAITGMQLASDLLKHSE